MRITIHLPKRYEDLLKRDASERRTTPDRAAQIIVMDKLIKRSPLLKLIGHVIDDNDLPRQQVAKKIATVKSNLYQPDLFNL